MSPPIFSVSLVCCGVRVRIVLTHHIHAGTMTGNPTIRMRWKRFAQDIRAVYRIAVFGWPADIPFVDPQQHRPRDASRLLHLWRTGQITFQYVTFDVVAAMEAHEGPRAPRRVRSDIGVRRPLRAPETRGRKRREGSDVKSAFFVPNSDSEPEVEVEDEIEEFSD